MTSRIAFLVACTLTVVRIAGAATYAVNTTADMEEGVGTVGDGICDVGGGQCTLRAALQEANFASNADIITIPAGTYTLSVSDTGDGSRDLDVLNPVTITGAGPLLTIIDANMGSGVLDVEASATISGLTLRNGLESSIGGGLYAYSDTPITVVVRDAQITANRAGHGGGVFVDGSADVTLERASISGNTGTTSGGAIEISTDAGVAAGGGSLTLRNVTVSDNVSGLYGVLNDGTLTLEQVTFVGDTLEGTGTTTVTGSILDAGASGTVCTVAVISGGHNLEHGTSCGFAMTGDVDGVDPQLGPLQNNGGGTLTRALPATSPAVDAGGATCGVSEDQRGRLRPLDGDGVGGAACDVGAYELDPADQPTSTTTTTTTPGASTTTTTTLAPGCGTEATFAVVSCRLGALGTRVGAAGTPGSFTSSIVTVLGKAKDKAAAAEAAAASNAKKGKKLLKKASALVKKARTKIGSKKGQKTFTDATVRAGLQSEADGIRSAMTTLGGTL
jgi:CSLREA domain-containing protein